MCPCKYILDPVLRVLFCATEIYCKGPLHCGVSNISSSHQSLCIFGMDISKGWGKSFTFILAWASSQYHLMINGTTVLMIVCHECNAPKLYEPFPFQNLIDTDTQNTGMYAVYFEWWNENVIKFTISSCVLGLWTICGIPGEGQMNRDRYHNRGKHQILGRVPA